MRLLVIASCALACVLAVGCGSVGEPLYPALNIPTSVTDLTAVERGDRIEIQFTVPSQTTEGLVVKTIGSIDLRVGPYAAVPFDPRQWSEAAQRVDVPPPEKPILVHAQVPVTQFVGKEVIVGVRVENSKGRASEWSNLVLVPVEAPLPTPAGLRADSVREGVRVAWTSPASGSFRILRRTGEEKNASPLATVDKPPFVDTVAEYGKSYDYYVQTFHNKAESDPAGPASVTPKDVFPPSVPAGLTASAGIASIELVWERNTDSDLKEYRVQRSDDGAPFHQVAEGLESPNYSDRGVQSGKHYRYRVIAVDRTGNPSEPSNPVEIVAP